MKFTFLGTGTSMGVPVAGGFGREKLTHDARNERFRCSGWIQTDELSILIDAGPEFRLQSIRAGITHIDLVLTTHQHMDHIAGLDDLRAYNYKQKKPIPLYASDSCIQSIRTRFDYMFGIDKYPGSTSLKLKEINRPLTVKDCRIIPLPVTHGNLKILGFRVNNLSYLTDVKKIPPSTRELIKGSEVLVLSGLRWEPEHPTHLTIPEAVEVARKLGVPQTYLIHMNASVDHESTNKRLPDSVKLAYDQQTLFL